MENFNKPIELWINDELVGSLISVSQEEKSGKLRSDKYELTVEYCHNNVMKCFDKLFEETNSLAFRGSKLEEVDFSNDKKTHNWQNYVPDELQKDWNLLTEREKKIIFVMADDRASAENWD